MSWTNAYTNHTVLLSPTGSHTSLFITLSLTPSSLKTLTFYCLIALFIPECHVAAIIEQVVNIRSSFSDVHNSYFLKNFLCLRSSFIFFAKQYSMVWVVYPFPYWGHFGCFQVLVLLSNLSVCRFSSVGWVPHSVVDRSCGKVKFSFGNHFQAVFKCSCIMHSHRWWIRPPMLCSLTNMWYFHSF